jgi:NAD(P)-dependent dehydrogenase (short-subunit alcohol dehydrogenase family)
MPDRKKALIAGATGVVGRNLLRHLLTLADWEVIAVCRRKPHVEGRYEHVAVDLLDRAQTFEALKRPRGVTHVFFSAYIERLALACAMNSGTVLAGTDGWTDDGCDRRDVADEIEIEFVVERRVDRVEATDQEQHVTVRRRSHDDFGANITAGTRPVLDDERLAEALQQPLTDQARDDVGRAASGKGGDQVHRPRWIGLRQRDARHGRQRGGACCEMQELPTGKFHG